MKKLFFLLFSILFLFSLLSFFSSKSLAACNTGCAAISQCPSGQIADTTQYCNFDSQNYQTCYKCVTAPTKPSCTAAGGTCTYGSCGTNTTIYGLGASDCAQNSASYSCCKATTACPANTSANPTCPTGTVKTQAGGGAPTGCYYCKVNTANICNSTNGGTCVYSSPGCAGSTPPLSVKTGNYYCISSDSVNSGGIRSDMQCCVASGSVSDGVDLGASCTKNTDCKNSGAVTNIYCINKKCAVLPSCQSLGGVCKSGYPGDTCDFSQRIFVTGIPEYPVTDQSDPPRTIPGPDGACYPNNNYYICCKGSGGGGGGGGGGSTPHTILSLTVGLDGIGHVGDQVNPDWEPKPNAAGSNQDPKTNPRPFTVNINGTNHSASLTFDKTNGIYKGSLDLGTSFASGSYTVKYSTQGHLTKALPAKVSITAGNTTNVPQVNAVTGDVDENNKLDILDYNILLSCLTDADITNQVSADACNTAGKNYKKTADLEDNGVTDKFDYNLFLREISKVQTGD